MFKTKKKVLNRIEGFGLILILSSFFLQLIQNDLESVKRKTENYYLNEKLDCIWRVMEKQYIDSHPELERGLAIDFEGYSDNWKIYSEQLKELRPWEDDANQFAKWSTYFFILGTIMIIASKLIDEKPDQDLNQKPSPKRSKIRIP